MLLVVIADWMGFFGLGFIFLFMIYRSFPGLLSRLQGRAKFVFGTVVYTIAVLVVDSYFTGLIKEAGCQVPTGFIIDYTKKLITSKFGTE